MTAEIGVILSQTGTPQSLDHTEVRRYLREFLSDQRIIDLPRWRWLPILHGIVLRTRPAVVAQRFAQIWTEQGSPLLAISRAQQEGIQDRLRDRYQVELALAYSTPNMSEALEALRRAGIAKIVVLPLFPQYSNATTASVYDAAMLHALGRGRPGGLPIMKHSPTLRFIHPFHDDPEYVAVLASSVRRQLAEGPAPDRIIVSYHGLPQHFDDAGDPYRGQCEASTRLLAEELGWAEGTFEIAYQSRFGRTKWITPYLHTRLRELHREGVEQPVVITPGFTTDCLETMHELAIEGRKLFARGGGAPDRFRVLACLNDDPAWLDYIADLIARNSNGW